MTSFLTFAVTGVRISGEIPVQSQYLPLINLYILLSIIYTLIGFMWFLIANHLSKKHHLPFLLERMAFVIRKILFCIFKDSPKTFNKTELTEKISNDTKIDIEKCNFCGRCKNCEKKFEEERITNLKINEIKLNVSALNYLAFFILFLIIFSCNLGIWVAMDSN
jgi:hypothetical protein